MFGILSFLAVSFVNASYLFIRILSTAKLLHFLQKKLQTQELVLRQRSAPVLTTKKEYPHLEDVIKIKYQVLRLIHRMTTPFLPIAFSEGNAKSFSPASIGSSISSTITISLMFLNTKYS